MTTDERVDAIAKTLEQLTGVVASLAGTVASHDRQIGALIENANTQAADTTALKAALADLSRQLQAYLTRMPPQ
jgi:ABC-type transporter Mla subunit MlaD